MVASKWDNSTPEELKKLDALEQMSVQLHRTYQILAKNIRKKEKYPWRTHAKHENLLA